VFRALVLAMFLSFGTGCQMFQYLSGNTPAHAVKKMEDPDFADLRREGLNDLMKQGEFAKKPPYTTRYGEIARQDRDYVVRAAAVRTINRSRDASSTKVLISALSDESDLVRLEAAKALNRLPDPAAIPALVRVLNNPEERRDVRIAAAEAVSHYRTIDTARALIRLLEERDFSLVWQARQSLTMMFDKDFGYNESSWLNYITTEAKL
jgi:HEAT repeat protein